MKPLYKFLFYFACLSLATGCMSSCSEMDDTYDQFLEGGEIIYVQGADSLRVYPGRNRIKLSWLAISDPTVSKAVVYWNNGRDSLEVPIEKTDGIDTINVLIEPLEEGVYNFEIYTYDNEGHRSVPSRGIGESFGEDYSNALLPRLVTGALYSDDTDTLEVIWGPVDPSSIGVEMSYTDSLGQSRTVFVPTAQTGADSTWITDYDHQAEGSFEFRSVYLPDPLSIDTFYTDRQTVEVTGPPDPYQREGWTATASSYDGRNGRTDRLPEVALDGDNATFWVNQISPQEVYPHWISADMGSIKDDVAGVWLGISGTRDDIPARIEVSVSTDGEEWTVIDSYQVANEAGTQYFDFPEVQQCRYFKIECLEASGNNDNAVIGEIGAYAR